MTEGDDRPDGGRGPRFNSGGYVYGVLALATVIAAESTRRETFPKLVGASAVILVLYWIAHAYAHFWASRLQEDGGRGSISGLLGALGQEAPILAGAAVPAVVLLVAWAVGASIETAVTDVLWAAGAELVVLEIGVGLRRPFSFRDMAVRTLIGISLGLGILVVRIILH